MSWQPPTPTANWQPIATIPPYRVVLLARSGDLYPVVGWVADDLAEGFFLEEGGAEDGEHRRYPTLVGWEPDLWAPVPDVPEREARSA